MTVGQWWIYEFWEETEMELQINVQMISPKFLVQTLHANKSAKLKSMDIYLYCIIQYQTISFHLQQFTGSIDKN